MEWYFYIITVGIGICVGFINVLAGAGSILSLAILMFLGLPANIANGTNRIAIFLSTFVGTVSYKQKQVFSFKEGIWFTIPAIIGAVIGAQLAVDLNKDLLEKIIGALLIVLFFLVLYKPEKWLKGDIKLQNKNNFWRIPLFFIIGLYGGFIQIGTGFFLLTAFVLGKGYNLIKANALKLFIIVLYTPFALIVFFRNEQVDILMGLTLGLGTMIGAFLGTKFAIKKGVKIVRYILLAVIVFASIKFLGLYDLLKSLLFS